MYALSQSLRSSACMAALVLLSACVSGPGPEATMMAARPAGAALASFDRQLVPVTLTAETVAQYAATPSAGQGGWRYLLGAGDVVQLYVVDAPELTLPGGAQSGYRVEEDGALQLPFLGRVPAADRTPEALRADIAARLRQYIANPQVDVRVTGFNARRVSVVGAVPRPNRQALTTTPLTVIDAVNAAGGFTGDAARDRVVLIRDGIEQRVDLEAFLTRGQPTPVLRDGDVLRVVTGAEGARLPALAEARPAPLRLMGADGQPRLYDLSGSIVSLAAVLGTQPPASGTVHVLRAQPGRTLVLQLPAAQALSADLGARLMLGAGDVIVLDPRPAGASGADLTPVHAALRALNL
ncbi:polysaccharide biosynthesis/export family protein [Cereibacter sphaeroides]|nr:polysaccharide biosynthesis/export family protein [Cereibacter sphaeroides]